MMKALVKKPSTTGTKPIINNVKSLASTTSSKPTEVGMLKKTSMSKPYKK